MYGSILKGQSRNSNLSLLPLILQRPNYSLSEEEKKRVITQYDAIKEEDRWRLIACSIVEDKMKALAKYSSFEHPVHSMIMDSDDIVWKKKEFCY